MDIEDPPSLPGRPREDRDATWAELNARLKALQDRYAKTRVGSEPRSFATRFRD